MAHSAEPYFYTYPKLKEVLSQNPQIKIVLIEFSNNQIDEKMNDWTWGYKYMSNMFPLYAAFLDRNDIDLLIKNNPNDFMSCLSIAAKKNLFRMLTFNYSYGAEMGGYLPITRSQNKLNQDSLNQSFIHWQHQRISLSMVNLQYLTKIIDYCHANHKTVYLIRSPQHRYYEYLSNERYFIRIKNQQFKNVELLDFDKFPLPDNDFADLGHLNRKGAEKFSKWFNMLINKGLFKQADKQAFINQNINSVN